MNVGTDLTSSIARALAAHAVWVARPDQVEWARAMMHEQEHLPPSASALSWALGCLTVCYRGRLHAMVKVPDLPRWLLLALLLLCLGPVCVEFIVVAVSTAQGYLIFTLPFTVAREGLIFGSMTLIGPVGLAVALWTLASPAHRPRPTLIVVLWVLVAWALTGLLGLLAQYGLLYHIPAAPSGMLGLFVPVVILPALAVMQLQWLGTRRSRVAGLAAG
jgi:hypothetical protein